MPKTAIQGQEVYYAEQGDGPAVVLVHGAGATHRLWEAQIELLRNSFGVLAPDLPGHGLSGGRGFATMKEYGHWLGRFVRKVGAEDPLVVGHSVGGAMVLEAALGGGLEPAGLGLISTGARLKVSPELLDGLKNDFEKALDVLASYFPPQEAPPFRDLSPDTVKNLFLACHTFDRMADLGRIGVPALVVSGEKDELTPLKFGRYLAENIKDATLVVLEGAAHNLPRERAEEVGEAIRAFAGGLFETGY